MSFLPASAPTRHSFTGQPIHHPHHRRRRSFSRSPGGLAQGIPSAYPPHGGAYGPGIGHVGNYGGHAYHQMQASGLGYSPQTLTRQNNRSPGSLRRRSVTRLPNSSAAPPSPNAPVPPSTSTSTPTAKSTAATAKVAAKPEISQEAKNMLASFKGKVLTEELAQKALDSVKNHASESFDKPYRVINANPSKGIPFTIHQFNDEGTISTIIDTARPFPGHNTMQWAEQKKGEFKSIKITQGYHVQKKLRVAIKQTSPQLSRQTKSFNNYLKRVQDLRGKELAGIENVYHVSDLRRATYLDPLTRVQTNYNCFIFITEAFDTTMIDEMNYPKPGVVQPRQLPLSDALEILSQAATGLKSLHDQELTLRDAKGGNLVMRKEDGKWVAKWTDFETILEEGSDCSATEVLGSDGFASHNVMKAMLQSPRPGVKTSKSDDIFALAVMIASAMEGRLIDFWFWQTRAVDDLRQATSQAFQNPFLPNPREEKMSQLSDPKRYIFTEVGKEGSLEHLVWEMLMKKVTIDEVVSRWNSCTKPTERKAAQFNVVPPQPSRPVRRTTSAHYQRPAQGAQVVHNPLGGGMGPGFGPGVGYSAMPYGHGGFPVVQGAYPAFFE